MTSEQRTNDKINGMLNGFTPWFRLITPVLLTLLGTLILTGVNDLKVTIKALDKRISENMQARNDDRVEYENRLTKLEIQVKELR